MTIFEFLVLARWIHFGAATTLFGSSLFWFYAFTRASQAPREWPESFAATRYVVAFAAVAAMFSGLAWLAGTIVNMTGDDEALHWSGLLDLQILRLFFFETDFGGVWIIRLALIAASLIAVAPWREIASLRALALIGALLLVSQAWLGHAAARGATLEGAFMIAAYAMHALAVGVWVGGLPALLLTLIEIHHTRKLERSRALPVLRRYSAMATAAVSLIVLTGAANVWFRVGYSLWPLVETAYGLALAVKLALVAAMLVLAFFNRFILMPKLAGRNRDEASTERRLRASISVELALGALTLGAAAVLGLTPPPQ